MAGLSYALKDQSRSCKVNTSFLFLLHSDLHSDQVIEMSGGLCAGFPWAQPSPGA